MEILNFDWKTVVLTFFIGVVVLLFFLFRHIYTYWQRNTTIHTISGANYLCGHFTKTLLRKEFVGYVIQKLYNSTTEPFAGIYSIFRPVLLVRDPKLIQTILIKDFEYFHGRGVHCNESYDPLSGNLFSLDGLRWKNLRSKLTPAFTSAKLKEMFANIIRCGSSLDSHLTAAVESGKSLDVRETAASFTTNVTASVGFGIDIDAIIDPDDHFRICGREIFSDSLSNVFRSFAFFNAPTIMSWIRLKIANKFVENFIISITNKNIKMREEQKVCRKDIFQLLIQLRNTGMVQLDDKWETVLNHNKNLTNNEVAAQTFLFFLAGFETSSTTLSFCLYELAKNPEIQERLHEEITRIIGEHGNLTYDAVHEMKYLECCISETLRKYPILPVINRICAKDYKIPETDHIIKKGVQVFIPAFALQLDEQYYENPMEFNPDRFNEKNLIGKNQLNQPNLAFGDGPRNCIGLRLGKLQTKIGLIMMLEKFRYELSDEHKNNEMILDPKFFFTTPPNGINLMVFKR